jgi:hypothetical protein
MEPNTHHQEIASSAQKALRRMAELWESHKPSVQHEARTLAGALSLMRKHGCNHAQEAIEQEAKQRAIAQFKAELDVMEAAL